MNVLRYTALVSAILCGAVLAQGALAQTLPSSEPLTTPRIVNGVSTHGYPSTGQLLYSGGVAIDDNNAQAWCSGTLIGCNTFLVAAHCVADDQVSSHYRVFLQHSGLHSLSSLAVHPSYKSNTFPRADVAVLKLATTVTGIDPTEINTVANPAALGFGLGGTIVGFGRTSGSSSDYGIKRAGAVLTAPCSGTPSGTGDTELVCWDFTNPVGNPGEDSNTCNGDSGGPLFMDLGTGVVVAGVTSGGENVACLAVDHSYDANVYNYRSFILSELAGDSSTVCGGIDPVGAPSVEVFGNSARLDAGNSSDTYSFTVNGTPNDLRFAMNAEDNGSLDADLYVKQGATVSTADFDCKATGASNFGACSFLSPASGQWSVLLQRSSGAGDYQLTTTVFGGSPPLCGNNQRELGEACDGSDAAACPGLCQPDCSCPAPVCGNGIIESGEICDGADPGPCPTSTCGVDCNCPAPQCGNNVTESGEDCDGSDDSACPGQCDLTCACPQACFLNDLFTQKVRSSSRVFLYKAVIDTFFNLAYDGLDPRNEFALSLQQGPNAIAVTIPANDTGWAKSRPGRGRFRWRGSIGGIRSVKAVENLNRFLWKIRVKGKAVPGAEFIDELALMDLRLDMDGVCTQEQY